MPISFSNDSSGFYHATRRIDRPHIRAMPAGESGMSVPGTAIAYNIF